MCCITKLIWLMNFQENVLNGEVEAFCRLLAFEKCDSFKGMLKLARKCKAAFPESCELLCGGQINSKQAKTEQDV